MHQVRVSKIVSVLGTYRCVPQQHPAQHHQTQGLTGTHLGAIVALHTVLCARDTEAGDAAGASSSGTSSALTSLAPHFQHHVLPALCEAIQAADDFSFIAVRVLTQCTVNSASSSGSGDQWGRESVARR